jgi:hypothetical protein
MSKLRDSKIGRRRRAACRGLWILSLAVVLGLVIASSAAIGSPLEKVTAPVKEVVETVTAPAPIVPPVSVQVPATPPAVPVKPPVSTSPIKVPATPLKPPSESAPGNLPSVKIPVPSDSSASQTLEHLVTTVAGGATKGLGEAVKGSGAVTGEATGADANRTGGGQTPPGPSDSPSFLLKPGTGSSDAADPALAVMLRSAWAVPSRRILAYVWPAIAIARPELTTFLADWASSASGLLAANESVLGADGGGLVGDGDSAKTSGGISDRLNVSLERFLSPFVPAAPLPTALSLVVGILGVILVWHVFRKELGLPPYSRPRRRI